MTVPSLFQDQLQNDVLSFIKSEGEKSWILSQCYKDECMVAVPRAQPAVALFHATWYFHLLYRYLDCQLEMLRECREIIEDRIGNRLYVLGETA